MASIEIGQNKDGKPVIKLESTFRDAERCKLVPGGKWNPKERVWEYRLSWATCTQLRSIFGQTLVLGEQIRAWGIEQRRWIDPALALRTAEDADIPNDALRPFQRAGVKFLSTARQALLADEMGLGKTVQAIAALENLGEYPALIVCPNSMKFTWKKEFAKWAPDKRVVILGHDRVAGKTKKGKAATKQETVAKVANGEADVLIVNWEALRLISRQSGYGSMELSDTQKAPKELQSVKWAAIVADEAHKMKNPKAQQSRCLWALGDDGEDAVKFLLTGTPVANDPDDLWSLMHFVSPADFPAKTKFLERYCITALNSWSGGLDTFGLKSETRDELFKILDPRLIRRTKKMVLPQLPDKQYTVREVTLGDEQRKHYNDIRDRMMTLLDEGDILMATNPLARMTRLIQFASATGTFEDLDDDSTLKLVDPSCKVDALVEIAQELGGEKAAVFSESRQLIDLAANRLKAEGYKVGLVTGTVTGDERQRYVDQFNEGAIQFILITLGAGGEGLSLTGSSTAIFLNRSFSLIKNLQGEDRLHGIGRGVEGKALNIIDIVAQDTIEADIFQVMYEKQAKLEEVVRDKATLKEWLSR